MDVSIDDVIAIALGHAPFGDARRSPRSAGGQRATTGQPGTCGTAPRKTAGWVGKCHIPPRRWDGPAKQARTYSKKRVAEEMGRDVFDYRVVDSRR
jgi:hypothetical protein